MVTPRDTNTKECVLYLNNRLGMVKIAAQHGVPIIPVFAFNQRDIFRYWVPRSAWIHQLGRKIGFIPLVFFGVFNLPYGPPKPCALNIVAGKPIMIPKLEDAQLTDVKLRPYLNEFISSIQRIFENNKAQFNMGDVTLRIE